MNKRLSELVAEQQKNLEALLQLSRIILEEIKKEEAGEGTDRMINERAAVLDELGRLDARLRGLVGENGPAPDPAYQKLGRTLEEVVRVEAECAAAMEGKKAELKGRLELLGRGGEALKGYAGAGPGPKFVDVKK